MAILRYMDQMLGDHLSNCVVVLLLTAVLFGTSQSTAQDSSGCADGAFLERVDSLYGEHLASRDADDELASFISVEDYHGSLGEIIEECRNTLELLASGVTETGSGAIDDPYAFNFFATLLHEDSEVRIRISDFVRESMRSSPGFDVVGVNVDVQCVSPAHLFCEMSYGDFDLIGRNGLVYDTTYRSGALSVELAQGGKDSGFVVIEDVEESDDDLMLIYRPNMFSSSGLIFFSAEPAPGQEVDERGQAVTITSTTSLNVRVGPGTSYSRSGVLPNGEQATAIGRNSAGTWVQFDRGWVFAQYVNASGDIMSLPVTA